MCYRKKTEKDKAKVKFTPVLCPQGFLLQLNQITKELNKIRGGVLYRRYQQLMPEAQLKPDFCFLDINIIIKMPNPMRHLKMFVVIGGKFENRKGTEFFPQIQIF